ncbi:hypothetical protein EV426DRAFT_702477 [Tirmania nivea]|nr:hypothetical protein EV426DRAFT_702477 [Tirmania nivea]
MVTRSRSKSPHKKKFMLRSSPQTVSSPFNSPAVKVTKSPALRNLTPLRRKTSMTSPIKFPLSLATTNELNTTPSEVTPPPNASNIIHLDKGSPGSPSVRHAMQRGNRAGIGVENGTGGSPLRSLGSPVKHGRSLSPVKRGRGSPPPKRRTANHNVSDFPFPGPSLSPPKVREPKSPSPKTGTVRKNLLKKNVINPGERPTYVKSRPQARAVEFATPTDPASKIRRTASLKNLSAMSTLPSASVHSHNTASVTRSSLKEAVSTGTSTETEWATPHYKLAKPDPSAFHSTGFIPKRGRLSTDSANHHQPETPCKKLSSYSVRMSDVQQTGSVFGEFLSPVGGSKSSLLGRRESRVMHNNDMSPTPLGSGNSSLSEDFDVLSTPTKSVYNTNLVPLFGNVGGTKRKGDSRPQSPYSIGTGRATRARVRESTQTPKPQEADQDSLFADASCLSIQTGARRQRAPQTPAKNHTSTSDTGKTMPRTPNNLPLESSPSMQISPDWKWKAKFQNDVRCIGYGEFSQVYLAIESRPNRLFKTSKSGTTSNKQLASPRVSSPPFQSSPLGSPVQPPPKLYAIKKSKTPYTGVKDRDQRLEEVRILMELGTHDHVIKFIDQWEENRFLFIQTEYCENGSLDKFLDKHGTKGRLDEFRVWKIMNEICMGIKHIHDCGFLHLDIKPANVLITLEGTLKISDFGMATRWPARHGIEREGDRVYLAPEVMQQGYRYDKPVDIFALGLTIIEAAGNEGLPPNGPVWQSIRSGDFSLAPILSTSVSGEFVFRDEKGEPLSTLILDGPSITASQSFSSDASSDSEQVPTGLLSPTYPRRRRAFYRTQSGSKKLLHDPRPGDLVYPPKFMEDGGLERIVQLMLAPDSSRRPKATDILDMEEVKWVESRRKCPATIFEGLWGRDPSYQGSNHDSEEILRQVGAVPDTSAEDFSMLSDM